MPALHPLNTTETRGFLERIEDKAKGMNSWLLEEKERDFLKIRFCNRKGEDEDFAKN